MAAQSKKAEIGRTAIKKARAATPQAMRALAEGLGQGRPASRCSIDASRRAFLDTHECIKQVQTGVRAKL